MSKGLEALHTIAFNTQINGMNFGNELRIIEKELKILEIIKKKEVNFEVFGAFETYKDYEIYYDKKFHLIENKLTKEEYYLLKEVINNDK